MIQTCIRNHGFENSCMLRIGQSILAKSTYTKTYIQYILWHTTIAKLLAPKLAIHMAISGS